MSFSIGSNNNIIQTGVDDGLSGLSGLTNVTPYGSNPTEYVLDGMVLDVQGSLSFNASVERLIFSGSPDLVNNNALLTLTGGSLSITADNSAQAIESLVVSNSVTSEKLIHSDSSSSVTLDGVYIVGGNPILLEGAVTIGSKGCTFHDNYGAKEFKTGTSGWTSDGNTRIIGFDVAVNSDISKVIFDAALNIKAATSSTTRSAEFVNNNSGTKYTIGGDASFITKVVDAKGEEPSISAYAVGTDPNNRGALLFYGSMQAEIRDQVGSPVENAVVYFVDSDSGNRFDFTTLPDFASSSFMDSTQTKEYTWVSQSDGTLAYQVAAPDVGLSSEVLLKYVAYTSNEGSSLIEDVRSNSNWPHDSLDVVCRSYGYLPVNTRISTGLPQTIQVEEDPYTYLTEALLNDLEEVSNLDQAYCLSKKWYVSVGAEADYPSKVTSLFSVDGAELISPLNIVLDPAAPQLFEVQKEFNRIVLKSSGLKSGSLLKNLTVNSITFQGSSALSSAKITTPAGTSGHLLLSNAEEASVAILDGESTVSFARDVEANYSYYFPVGSPSEYLLCVKKPGCSLYTQPINSGKTTTIELPLKDILNPDGLPSYSGSVVSGILVSFVADNCEIQITGEQSVQSVVDALQKAYATEEGIKWLARGNREASSAVIEIGSFLYFPAEYKFKATSFGAMIKAFVFFESQDYLHVDSTYPVWVYKMRGLSSAKEISDYLDINSTSLKAIANNVGLIPGVIK